MIKGVVGVWFKAGKSQGVAIYLKVFEVLSRGKETDSFWVAPEGKLDQWGKLWGEIFQLNTKPSEIALRNMMPGDEVSLLWVTVGVSGGRTLCHGCCTERIYFLDKVSLLLRYISIFNCISEQFRCHFSNSSATRGKKGKGKKKEHYLLVVSCLIIYTNEREIC